MPYRSIDELQRALADGIFSGRTDTKKAAGRALGTIVEIITYYLFRAWGLEDYTTIELRLPEFGNDEIVHNVEFALHPVRQTRSFEVEIPAGQPVSTSRLRRGSGYVKALLSGMEEKTTQPLSRDGLRRNASVIGLSKDEIVLAFLEARDTTTARVRTVVLGSECFAMIESKRVGVEEGQKKGPTTIEKAKQGAYVANHSSSLQKVRDSNGNMYGVWAKPNGHFDVRLYDEVLEELVYGRPREDLEGFVLTVGVVSNHGNWFTSDDPNKELLVLKQSYDWLLFLNDDGVAEFVEDVLLKPAAGMGPARAAFLASYGEERKGTRFTKVKIDQAAHLALESFVEEHLSRIENNWLSVLSPASSEVVELRDTLAQLGERLSGSNE